MRVSMKQYRYPDLSCKYERFERRVNIEDAARNAPHKKSAVVLVRPGVVRRKRS